MKQIYMDYFKIKKIEEIIPSGIDGHKYRLTYEAGNGVVVGGYPEAGHIIEGNIDIEASGTLQAVWRLNDAQMIGTSGDAAAAQLIPFLIKDRPHDLPFVAINTYTAPQDPSKIFHIPVGKEIPIKEIIKLPVEKGVFQSSFLGVDISDTRDSINAISISLFGEKLLDLPQERALFDMYKIPTTKEEFGSRLASLSGLAVAINGQAVEKYLKRKFEVETKSISKLEELLKVLSTIADAQEVCNTLRKINKMRQGYPIHGDNVDGVIESHDYFKIEYPITNFSLAWEKIVNKYFESLKTILHIVKSKRESLSLN